jgi:bacterioferritin (cytochrome b1)
MTAATVVDLLNELLEDELTAVEYYRIHAEAIPDQEIAQGVNAILPVEQGHAVGLTTRIAELGGEPVRLGGPASERGRRMGEESRDKGLLAMLRLELAQEKAAIKAYAAAVAEVDTDMVTLEMLEEQLLDEMRHARWLKMKIMESTE